MESNKNLDTSGNQRILICGPSASGKSVLAKTLLTEHFKGKFHQIYLICPTMHQKLWLNIRFKGANGKTDEKSNKFDEATNETFEKVLESVKANYKKEWRSLIILDDCINTELMQRNSALCREFLRIRHYNCTVLLLTQNLKGCPPFLRSNCTSFASFHNPSFDEVSKMCQEYGNSFLEAYKAYTNEPYKFVWCNLEENELSGKRYTDHIVFPDKF